MPPSRHKATLLGVGAIALWATLAALTTLAGAIPPFQLAAMTFALGTCVGLGWAVLAGQSLAVLRRVPAGAWALGVYGLLAFHVCYFLALRHAPPLEASLIVYLWPLLIVLMSGALPSRLGGGRLTLRHVTGAILGLIGAVLILKGSATGEAFGGGHLLGYVLALGAAFIWSSYSVGSRLYAGVPSTAVVGSCLATSLGAAALHVMLEDTVWPASGTAWLAVVGLGLGPVGLAFYLWDEGMKRGDITLLGVAAYATPLLSSVLLVVLGLGHGHAGIWIAALLITAGALLAGWNRDTPSTK